MLAQTYRFSFIWVISSIRVGRFKDYALIDNELVVTDDLLTLFLREMTQDCVDVSVLSIVNDCIPPVIDFTETGFFIHMQTKVESRGAPFVLDLLVWLKNLRYQIPKGELAAVSNDDRIVLVAENRRCVLHMLFIRVL